MTKPKKRVGTRNVTAKVVGMVAASSRKARPHGPALAEAWNEEITLFLAHRYESVERAADALVSGVARRLAMENDAELCTFLTDVALTDPDILKILTQRVVAPPPHE